MTEKWHCKLCGYDWAGRLPTGMVPRACPRCKRYDYDHVVVTSKQKTMVLTKEKGGE